jgi:peptide/nickel transport system substrate-binding protein
MPSLRKYRATAVALLSIVLLTVSCDLDPSPVQPTAVTVDNTATAVVATAITTGIMPATPDATGAPPTATTSSQSSTPGPGSAEAFIIAQNNIAYETLDPSFCYEVRCGELLYNIYEPLIYPKKDKVDEFVPQLATKWDISADGKTYVFTIRKGVKFHEGSTLTPEDVAYSLWRTIIQDRAAGPTWLFLQPLFGLEMQSFKADVVGKQHNGDWVAGCEAVKKAVTFDNSAGTVTLNLKQPFAPMLQITGKAWGALIMSKEWVSEQGGWNGDCSSAQKYHDPKAEEDELFNKANGTGPYKLERWTPSQEVVLVRHDGYWRTEPAWEGGPSGPARIKRIIIKGVKEWGTRFANLQAGDADLIEIPPQYRPQVDPLVKEVCDAQTGGCTVGNPEGFLQLHKRLPNFSSAGALFLVQQVNVAGGNPYVGSGKLDGNGIPPDFFSDLHIRKAFNYCFDWDTLIDEGYSGEAEQVYGPITRGQLGYDAQQAHYSLDLAKCEEEFRASTLKSPDGKSLWDVGFIVQFPHSDGAPHVAADILKDNLSKVNSKFRLETSPQAGTTITKDRLSSRMPIYEYGWIEDYHDPHNWASAYLSSSGFHAVLLKYPQELQKELDSLVLKGVQETNLEKRAEYYSQMQNIAYEQALSIYTVQAQGRYYKPISLKGWYYNPSVFWNYFYAWYIE